MVDHGIVWLEGEHLLWALPDPTLMDDEVHLNARLMSSLTIAKGPVHLKSAGSISHISHLTVSFHGGGDPHEIANLMLDFLRVVQVDRSYPIHSSWVKVLAIEGGSVKEGIISDGTRMEVIPTATTCLRLKVMLDLSRKDLDFSLSSEHSTLFSDHVAMLKSIQAPDIPAIRMYQEQLMPNLTLPIAVKLVFGESPKDFVVLSPLAANVFGVCAGCFLELSTDIYASEAMNQSQIIWLSEEQDMASLLKRHRQGPLIYDPHLSAIICNSGPASLLQAEQRTVSVSLPIHSIRHSISEQAIQRASEHKWKLVWLSGPAGSGRTTLLQSLSTKGLYLDLKREVKDLHLQSMVSFLRCLRLLERQVKPDWWLIDNLDAVFEGNVDDLLEQRQFGRELSELIYSLSRQKPVVLTVSSGVTLIKEMDRLKQVSIPLEMGHPNAEERRAIIGDPAIYNDQLIRETNGFSFAEVLRHLIHPKQPLNFLEWKGPKWEELVGLEEVKRRLEDELLLPFMHSDLVILYGPSGCGKTVLAEALLHRLRCHAVRVYGPELLNKYIGSSERAVRSVFEEARRMRPSVILFDDFDSLVPRRGQDNTGTTDRVVNQFLALIDGSDYLDGVSILATTSRLDLIDPAILRPGRIECHIPVGKVDQRRAEVGSRATLA